MRRLIACLSLLALWPSRAQAWHDRTHVSLTQAAGSPYCACVAVAADALVRKRPAEVHNHYSNRYGARVSAAQALAERSLYDREDPEGHLYGAVLASFAQYLEQRRQGVDARYAFGFLAHYVGDLSQPLHNAPYDAFNRAHHAEVDGLVERCPNLAEQIALRMRPWAIHNDAELVDAVVRLGNAARAANPALRRKGLSQADALALLGQSASLLRALQAYADCSLSAAPCP